MVKPEDILNTKLSDLVDKYPFLMSYFDDNDFTIKGHRNKTLNKYLSIFNETDMEDRAFNKAQTLNNIVKYINQMITFLGIEENGNTINSLSIIAGTDKSGKPENFDELIIKKSEIICIVGPTGSGKSRLLADIEWTAQGDTPTKRSIMIDEKKPDMKWRFSSSNKLVAQLSQNMNFVMDLTVLEFLSLHAKSRLVENEKLLIKKIIDAANDLAGEKFDLQTPITSLSGGQSRALMIADTAILSSSPIILIDEIENAGIDRKKALKFLVGEEKIVLMATHDPILALMGNKRIIIKNGGINKIIKTSNEEKNLLLSLEKMDGVIQNLRTNLRSGKVLKKNMIEEK
jgi:ABC-type lipoprotein export system ATPase subunit